MHIALLIETNATQDVHNADRIEHAIKVLERKTTVIGFDSEDWKFTKKNYLPRQLIIIIRGKIKAMFEENSTCKGWLGN